MTPTEIDNTAQEVAADCIRAIQKCRTNPTGCTDRDIREIIAIHVEDALSKAVLGVPALRDVG